MSGKKHPVTSLMEDLMDLGLMQRPTTPLQDFVEQVAADEDDSQEKEVPAPFTEGGLADKDDDREEKEESTQVGGA